ncbi:response regulator [Streptomyces tubercidicus]|uniref:DNA-binding response regulator n=1 Tax=Streptomyces tubercidicus TaxID=47759 RepID=A0A640UTE3_9ACTN|nr:response regulator transcription factor [Streptomyces tubercidicus]WAU12501.1 response regulator transcription factor [Streptomyces tubercidicus]GFE37941.1 DNA-binding response regulator [Streptomyces tubercidicus]
MSPSAAGSAHTPVSVLLCEDHAVIRAGLLALLGSAHGIEVIGEAGDGEEAVALAAVLRPDVVLMDLELGSGLDGVEATRRITRADAPGAPDDPDAPGVPHVLVLTTYDTDADIARAIEAGAAGHLLKAEPPEELFAAIRAAAEGRSTLAASVAHRVLPQMRSPRPTLTDRELKILGRLARGLSIREIARALSTSEATVKTQLERIYDKLGVASRTAAVSVAREHRLLP